jgi:4-carboxymuconolactone decarboxylase
MGGPRSIESDCFLGTVAALIAMGRREELPTHLRRTEEDGPIRAERAALIRRLAFYAGFRAAITALAIADATVSQALVTR